MQVALEAGSTADPSKPQTRKDLSRLSKADLEAWIASAEHRGSMHSKDRKQTLLTLAEGIWNSLSKLGKDPSELHVSEDYNIDADEIQSRADLDGLRYRDLTAWIRCKGPPGFQL